MSAPGQRRIASVRPTLPRLLALAIALALGASPGAAAAGSDLSSTAADPYGSAPGGQSAGDQYVETLPTTRGPRAPSHHKRAKKLSHGVTRKIDTLGGSDAAQLKTLATSLGAPTEQPAGGKSKRKSASRSGKRHGSSTPAVPSAAINAVDGGEAGLGWLVVALLAITALALGAVGYQRRRDRGSPR
jgi:hypothetical protein